MVAPISSKVTVQNITRPYSYRKEYYRQKPPYNLRLPCRLWYAKALNSEGNSGNWSISEDSSPVRAAVQNKARERMKSELGDTASWGAAIAAEWRGSLGMITNRAMQLLRFTKALKRGRFGVAAAELGVVDLVSRKVKRKHVRAKDLGGLWLEYSYGWAPLVGDIYGGCRIIDRPVTGDRTIKGRATERWSKTTRTGNYPYYTYQFYSFTHKCQVIADAQITNPNLFLANQVGLTNPASWILEGIPFSFVVDWFSNLSQFVSQLTDFLGLDLKEAATTDLVTGRDHMWLVYDNVYYEREDKQFVCTTRVKGIPSVKLHFEYEVPNWKRGLNAISLLTQALPSVKKRA